SLIRRPQRPSRVPYPTLFRSVDSASIGLVEAAGPAETAGPAWPAETAGSAGIAWFAGPPESASPRSPWRTKSRLNVPAWRSMARSEEHTSELQSRENLVCRLL